MRATSLGHAGILIETAHGSIVCDPWFEPAFFGSWFVFPRNDQLAPDLMERVERAEFLYVSHLHADHLDEPWLRAHLRRDITVVLPGFPSEELERTLRGLGFTNFIRTVPGQPREVAPGLTVTIFTETSISDGPGGDSAIVVDDGVGRLLNQNDCRPHDPLALTAGGPIDVQFLQYSGAIWYPMVYDEPEETKRAQVVAKVDAQFARAMQYVSAVNATVVAPSAGPPCFLDPDLAGLNMVTGNEVSIFPDQLPFLERIAATGNPSGRLTVPGTCFTIERRGEVTIHHPAPDDEVRRPFADKAAYLAEYARDWAPWLARHRSAWPTPQPDLAGRLAEWWNPLLSIAPTVRSGIGANILISAGDDNVIVDVAAGEVRRHHDEPFGFRFEIPRPLVESVVQRRAVDWSNALFLSLRFRAWRAGSYNEYVYNFLKSLSPDRMRRTEAEAAAKRAATASVEEITIGDYRVERFCPHRKADLTRFGVLDGDELVCTLHGWRFATDTGMCHTSEDTRPLRIRRTTAASRESS
jgi:UDP-MurNAc hydroxylase